MNARNTRRGLVGAATLAVGTVAVLLSSPMATTAAPVTAAGNAAVIAVEGPGNSLDFYSQAYATASWQEEVVAGPGTTFSAPSVSSADGSWVVAAQGAANSLDFYWQAYGTTPWAREVVAGPGTTFAPPSVTAANRTSVAAALGPSHSLDFYSHTGISGPWHPEVVAGPGTSFSAPSLSAADGASVIAIQGSANSLDFFWQSYGAVPWHEEIVAGPKTTYDAPAVAAGNSTSEIAAQGPGYSLLSYWHTGLSGTWSLSQAAGPGTTVSAPSLGSADGSWLMTAQGPGSSLDYYWVPYGGGGWRHQVVAGAGTTWGAPWLTTIDDNSTVIAVHGAGNSLDYYWQTYGTAPWHPEVVTSSGLPATTTATTGTLPPLPSPALCTAPAQWATGLQLRAGCSLYLYVGSESGDVPIYDFSWAPDLSVIASFSGNLSVSIGRSVDNDGGFSTLPPTRSYAIAGVGIKGYAVVRTFVAQTSVIGPCSGCGLRFFAGPGLQLRFYTNGSGPVLILVGGQGTGTLVMSGLTTYALANGTFSGGSGVLASAAIFKATLPAGWYTARFTSRTTLNNSGASLGAVAYELS